MRLKLCAAVFCATAIALAGVAASTDAAAEGAKKRVATTKVATTKKVAKKKFGPVPVSMAPPRARITVTRRTFLDPGTEVLPGSQSYFTDYAFPPAYSPTAVIDHRNSGGRGALPGPFDLPGRGNPYPWNWCVGC